MSDAIPALVKDLQGQFGTAVTGFHDQHGDLTVLIAPDRIADVLGWLKTHPVWAFEMLMDVGGIDYLTYPVPQPERYAVAYHLYSLSKNHRVRLKAYVPADDPTLPTAVDLWKTADWMEREVWDQFGIKFTGHPNMKRILNHMEFVGHPLRKDYPIKRRQALSANDTLADEMAARLKLKGLA